MDTFNYVQQKIETSCYIIAYEKKIILAIDENSSEQKNMTKIELRRKKIKTNVEKLRAKTKKDDKKNEKIIYRAKKKRNFTKI